MHYAGMRLLKYQSVYSCASSLRFSAALWVCGGGIMQASPGCQFSGVAKPCLSVVCSASKNAQHFIYRAAIRQRIIDHGADDTLVVNDEHGAHIADVSLAQDRACHRLLPRRLSNRQ